ncbi:hypothetical protein IQ241_20015 [Romeria aff. gracilis LEGE 07310]|uniref:Uncharacterized protein n=1 Tax=Vasconcelosia minhoensis LEGE 07310 TaxID=915328 RepID=A0A8J7AU49_9CYAN|nr:hypothetical protein [Romeria gracilis]MBE9079554.1 hypothetical protein [Romeria aff. gracilis LEGE 07310]
MPLISQSDIVISVLSGFLAGAIFSILDNMVMFLVERKTEIGLAVFVRGFIFLGSAIGLLFGLIGGTLISTGLLPKAQISNFMFSQGVTLSLIGLFIGIGKFFFHKVRNPQDSD